MKLHHKSIILLSASLNLCCNYHPTDVEKCLKMAGHNRNELENVITYYKTTNPDSLKLAAAYFLIGNMAGHYFYRSNFYDAYLKASDQPEFGGRKSDSVILAYGKDFSERVYDCQVIKSGFLINNIEMSFKVWNEQPWGKHIPFDIFCEYILPYRVSNEPLSDWKQNAYDEYNQFLDSVRKSNVPSISEAARIINKKIIKKGFRFSNLTRNLPGIGFEGLSKHFSGFCRDASEYTVYCLRAVGIPAGQDMVSQWGNRSSGHIWNFVIDERGKALPYDGAYTNIGIGYIHNLNSKKGKVFRRMYSHRDNVLSGIADADIPILFRDPWLYDASGDYWSIPNVSVPASGVQRLAYLAVFDNKAWVPVQWGILEHAKYIFPGMEPGVVYLPVYYRNNLVIPFQYPFILENTGLKRILEPSVSKHDIQIYRKYSISRHVGFFTNVIGGCFQASIRPDFKDAVDLGLISDLSYKRYQTVNFRVKRKFRYLRFLSAKGGYGNIAEMRIYNKDSILKGTPIGMFCCAKHSKSNNPAMAFDGNTLSYYDSCQPDGAWVGIDFGRSKHITKIDYACRNDDNYVRQGDLYELFYHDRFGWVSLGKKKGEGGGLFYKNVPKNALLWLHDYSGGTEERIFTQDSDRPLWW